MDGKHFKVKDMQEGVTAPPFHPNCRCTTVPYYEDDLSDDFERVARAEDGNNVYVNGKMTYTEWEKKCVANSRRSGIINYAKVNDIFFFDEDDLASDSVITLQKIADNLETSQIGRETIEYIKNTKKLLIKPIYEPEYTGTRGEQFGNEIKIYMKNVDNVQVAAETVIHEITHHKYNIGGCVHDEVICYLAEYMHRHNTTNVSIDVKRKIIKSVKAAYGNLKWRK